MKKFMFCILFLTSFKTFPDYSCPTGSASFNSFLNDWGNGANGGPSNGEVYCTVSNCQCPFQGTTNVSDVLYYYGGCTEGTICYYHS